MWPRLKNPIPAPLVALVVAATLGAILKSYFPEFTIATIGSRFGNPAFSLSFDWPWNFSSGSAHPLSFETMRALLPSAFAIAVLGAIESLLSATIADGMAQTKHDPDTELMALGVGNILCPFAGGIAATGAIARTATNIRFGARTPLSAMFHALITLLCVMLFANWITYLPMSALAALLLLVAYNISDIRHFAHITRVAPRSDVIVLWTCFLLTVVFDMVVGVTAGVILAALLFMRRMASITSTRMLEGPTHPHKDITLPRDIIVYEIVGPLFFGAAENAIGALRGIGNHVRGIVFVLEDVPMMDVTGLVAFESAIKRFIGKGKVVYLVGLAPQPLELLTQAGVIGEAQHVKVFDTLEEALKHAG
jgi:SulP family sulfate permease